MNRRLAIPYTFAAVALLGTSAPAPARANELFTPVYEIMTQDQGPESPGCRGCHIGPNAWARPFGDAEEAVLAFFESDFDYLLGGGCEGSYLAYRLINCEMPMGGRCWDEAELAALCAWIDSYL
jgi:hypothetical protein